MDSRVRSVLESVEVAEPSSRGSLQIFGLDWGDGTPLTYTTLDDALQAETLEVTEVDEGGSVPEIKVINKGNTSVFLMAGEQLVGAKQNRVVNASMMVPAKGELVVPVSCVEQGRWGYRTRSFRSGGSSSHSRLRRMMTKDVSAGYRTSKRPTADQARVWSEVRGKLGSMGSRSPSGALHQCYEDHEEHMAEMLKGEHGAEFKEEITAPSGCRGVAFAIGGRLAGVDLFDKPETLSKLFPKVVRAYAIDAMEEAGATAEIQKEAVESWFQSVRKAPSEPFKSPGLGDDIRIEGGEVVGACLVVEECPVHLELFAEEASVEQQVDESKIAILVTSSAILPLMRTALEALRATDAELADCFQSVAELPREITESVFWRNFLRRDADVLDQGREQFLARASWSSVPGAGMRIVFTEYGLEDRWFTHWHQDQRTAVVSLHQWDKVSELPATAFVARTIVKAWMRTLSPSFDPYQMLHEETRGCLFDFCGQKSDINCGLRSGTVCRECNGIMESMGLPLERIQRVLDAVRNLALAQY